MICRIITGLMLLAWLAGVALFFVNQGLDNDVLDVLTALVLTPLGLPWNLAPIFTGGSEAMRLAVALGAPVINVLIVWSLCRVLARRLCPRGC